MHVGKKHIETALLWFGVCTVAFCAGMIVGLAPELRAPPKRVETITVPFPPPAPAVPQPLEPPKLSPPHDIDAYAAPLVVPKIINPDAAPEPKPTLQRDAATEHRLKCLTPKMRAEWDKLEGKFGTLKVISTCDHSLYVAGTRRVSHHVSGNAVDFLPANQRQAILTWLNANYHAGLVMTYPDSDHIHIDIGHAGVLLTNRDKAIRVASMSTKPELIKAVAHPLEPRHRTHARHVRSCGDDDDDWF